MKRSSILTRINLSLLAVSVVFAVFVVVQIVVGLKVSESSEEVTTRDMPVALYTQAMQDELGDMNSNLLEYVLGESEEKQEYFANKEEFDQYRKEIPPISDAYKKMITVDRLIATANENAQKRVFSRFDPILEEQATRSINRLIVEVGGPLENLLDDLKEEEVADVGSSNDLNQIINDDLPAVRYYLELVDEAGDMLADLDRFVLGDQNARKSFFGNALQFESFLASLKPLEKKPHELVRIAEVERLFNELKSGGAEVFEIYAARNRIDALAAIEDIEHNAFGELEELLEGMSSHARRRVENSMNDLVDLSNKVNYLLIFTLVGGVALLVAIVTYTKRSIFAPMTAISESINKLRGGQRDFEIAESNRNDEIGDIINSLRQFQAELTELDELRLADEKMQANLKGERDKLSSALENLEQAQDKLIASEKLASLGSLVAGVSHEINTPIGVSVTMSSHLKENIDELMRSIKAGELKQSFLDQFEREAEESFSVMESSLDKASHLIQNFKQVATDQSSSSRRKFALKEVIDEVMMTVRHQLKGTNYKYRVEGDADLMLDSYPGPLGQVVTNLFNNSIMHGFDGRDEGEINIRFACINDNVKIYFKDNGAGIDETKINRIFDPFFTTKLGQGGSGLGLNIVHNIVTGVLGGSISVSSKVGTEFEVVLPLVAPKQDSDDE
ncbi:sensor histidine kinase [Neptuniibacter sp. QD29_5]|uniref:sensor histidine kinase n=1 Tax=Neptuniibacter sp. QD29_5 TaxID=3398207 RepID=UPI0039F580F0